LRPIDVDLRHRELDINGVWETPPNGKRAGQGKVRVGQRKLHPKNRKRRMTPYAARSDSRPSARQLHLVDALLPS
jgi:hypothetical protein